MNILCNHCHNNNVFGCQSNVTLSEDRPRYIKLEFKDQEASVVSSHKTLNSVTVQTPFA